MPSPIRARRALLAALALSLPAFCQSLPTSKPEEVGLSAERLGRIRAAVDRKIQDGRIAGAVTMVVRKGRVAWLEAQGMSDREARTPMRPDALFRICSMTKPNHQPGRDDALRRGPLPAPRPPSRNTCPSSRTRRFW